MDETPGKSVPPVIRDLLRQPHRYAFGQVLTLLRLWTRPQSARELEQFLRTRLRFRPALSMGFAVSDVTGLDLTLPAQPQPGSPPFDKARITATFLGLYGTSSPLPKFYTERLLNEQAEDASVTRDFLDICNNQFFLLHALISSSAHPLYRRMVGHDPKTETMLMALASFGEESLCHRLPDARMFLRYAGFFSQRVRTASGLRAVLADASGCAQTHIHCNVLRMSRIPLAQRFCLGRSGALLGEEATLGDAVPCYESKFVVALHALDKATFHDLLPGSRRAGVLHALTRNYCRQALDYAVTAQLLPGEVPATCLGGDASGSFASLGLDTWLGFGGPHPAAPLPAVTADYPAGFA